MFTSPFLRNGGGARPLNPKFLLINPPSNKKVLANKQKVAEDEAKLYGKDKKVVTEMTEDADVDTNAVMGDEEEEDEATEIIF